jgi:nitroreductase
MKISPSISFGNFPITGKIRNLIKKNRSYRHFDERFSIDASVLRNLIDLTRLSPSSANLQPLKYILSINPQKNLLIFNNLKWAGYFKNYHGPSLGERPTAYIIILGDYSISHNFDIDAGIACQSILLGMTEKGLGGCIISSINRENLRELLEIPEKYKIILAIALGKPKEKIIIEKVKSDGNIMYWRDSKHVHHVPKRSLNDLIIQELR